jgi:four helix bundle protein
MAIGNGQSAIEEMRAPITGISSHRDLRVWEASMQMVVACYEFTKRLPRDEIYGLTSQIRRAATSVPANIAEGYGREVSGSYIQHLRIAQGSLKELETLLEVAARVGYCSEDVLEPLLSRSGEIGRMLRGLIRAIQTTAGA